MVKSRLKIDNKAFFRQILILGLPVMLQSLINSLVSMMDVFMVGQLGEQEITATSLGNQWGTLFYFVNNGISAAGGMFIAQYWGARDIRGIHKYMGIMYTASITLATLFIIVTQLFPTQIISLYSKDPVVIELGGEYVKLVCANYLLSVLTAVVNTALVSTEHTVLPMIGTTVSLFSNMALNYVFIFGKLGLPAMGVRGAAVATVLAGVIGVVFIFGVVIAKKYPIMAGIKEYFTIPSEYVRKFLRNGFFVIMCEVFFGVGTNIYNMGYKYTGTEGQAALQIVNSFQQLSMVASVGICTACSVMIGKKLGEREYEMAKLYSRRIIWMIPAMALLLGLVIIALSPALLSIFNISELAHGYAMKMMFLLALVIPLKAESYACVVGTLRSGGDSWYCFLTNFVGNWFVGIPMVFLGAKFLALPVYWVYLMASMDEVGKLCVCLPRVISCKWIRNLTE